MRVTEVDAKSVTRTVKVQVSVVVGHPANQSWPGAGGLSKLHREEDCLRQTSKRKAVFRHRSRRD